MCTAIIVNMSEEAAHQPTNPPELPERPDPELTEDVFTRPDPVLQQLADRSHQVGMTVTLYLPWGAASGLIIGGAKYFAWVASNVRGHAANEEGDRAKMLGGSTRHYSMDGRTYTRQLKLTAGTSPKSSSVATFTSRTSLAAFQGRSPLFTTTTYASS